MFATALFTAFCLENRDTYVWRFSVITVIDCKKAFQFVTKAEVPTGIDIQRCAIDLAIIRGTLTTNGCDVTVQLLRPKKKMMCCRSLFSCHEHGSNGVDLQDR